MSRLLLKCEYCEQLTNVPEFNREDNCVYCPKCYKKLLDEMKRDEIRRQRKQKYSTSYIGK